MTTSIFSLGEMYFENFYTEGGFVGIIKHGDASDHFTQLPNTALRDSELSWTAIGLLGHLLSHSDGYKVTVESLARASRSGSTQTRSALKELRQRGYVHFKGRIVEDGRYTSSQWVVFSVAKAPDPALEEDGPRADIPSEQIPHVQNTHEENEHVYIEYQYKNTNYKNTNEKNIDESGQLEQIDSKGVPDENYDEWKQTLLDFMGVNAKQVVGRGWKEIHKAIKEIQESGATIQDLRERCAEYHLRYEKLPHTVNALMNNWSSLANTKQLQDFQETYEALALLDATNSSLQVQTSLEANTDALSEAGQLCLNSTESY